MGSPLEGRARTLATEGLSVIRVRNPIKVNQGSIKVYNLTDSPSRLLQSHQGLLSVRILSLQSKGRNPKGSDTRRFRSPGRQDRRVDSRNIAKPTTNYGKHTGCSHVFPCSLCAQFLISPPFLVLNVLTQNLNISFSVYLSGPRDSNVGCQMPAFQARSGALCGQDPVGLRDHALPATDVGWESDPSKFWGKPASPQR